MVSRNVASWHQKVGPVREVFIQKGPFSGGARGCTLLLSPITIGCKMLTNRLKLFHNYLRGYRYKL